MFVGMIALTMSFALQLGFGTTTNRESTPVAVVGLTDRVFSLSLGSVCVSNIAVYSVSEFLFCVCVCLGKCV